MHIVTKVLVVFAAVLSLLLAALTIAYSVNSDRIVNSYRGEVASRIAATQAASDAVTRAVEETTRLNAAIASLNNETASLEARVRELQTENAGLITDVKTGEVARSSFENKIAQLGETTKTQADLIEGYRDEVTTLRVNELDFRKKEIELVDRLNDVESQREVLEQNVRALQEQLVAARQSIEQGVAGDAAAGARGPVQFTGPLTRGRIVKTMKDPSTGSTLAQIDLGTNNQVRENMQLYIARGNEFLANLVIIQADLRSAVGRIELQQGEVRAGDVVQTRLR